MHATLLTDTLSSVREWDNVPTMLKQRICLKQFSENFHRKNCKKLKCRFQQAFNRHNTRCRGIPSTNIYRSWRREFSWRPVWQLPTRTQREMKRHRQEHADIKRAIHTDIHTHRHIHTTTHHKHFTALFPGPPVWAGATRELLDFMAQGGQTHIHTRRYK